MQKPVFYSTLFLVIMMACNKDKFQTKPTIKIKSLSTNNVPLNESLFIDLEFTDKEGDVQDTIFLKKVRLNTVLLPTIRLDTFNLPMPTDMPDKRKGEIRLILNQDYLKGSDNPGSNPTIHDTIMFKILLKDRANNLSDTAKTETIIVQRQQ
jgi:hypothetical protein